jgi:phosphoserine phosphatase RsbU/P
LTEGNVPAALIPGWSSQPSLCSGRGRLGSRVCLILLLVGWAIWLRPTDVPAATEILVGTYPNPPLVFRDSDGRYRGIYIDILAHIARQRGWTIRYVYGSWDEGLGRLRRQEMDLLLAIGYTPERAELYDFNRETVLVNSGRVYVSRGGKLGSLWELTGKRLAVVRGDVYYEMFRQFHQMLGIRPEFMEVEGYADALRTLEARRADAALVPRIFGAYEGKQFSVVATDVMFGTVDLRFAGPKGRRPDLLEALDASLQELKADKGSVYYRSQLAWLEGMAALLLPGWLKPEWAIGGVVSIIGLIGGMALILRWQLRIRTAALRESLAVQERIASELQVARDIQRSSMPSRFPEHPDYEIHACLEPARAVGGDFYDCFIATPKCLAFFLGDVSDKGIPAALFMAATKTVLATSARLSANPGEMVASANLHATCNNELSMFATVICGLLELDSGSIRYTNAGHNPPILLRADGRVDLLAAGRYPALGLDEDATYGESPAMLAPGDTLFLYTDGITEAMDPSGRQFLEERLEAELLRLRDLPVVDLIQQTVDCVRAHAADAPQSDDIAILAIRRRPLAGSRA